MINSSPQSVTASAQDHGVVMTAQAAPPHVMSLEPLPPARRRADARLDFMKLWHSECLSLFLIVLRWGKSASSTCDCGMKRQTIHHLAYDCENRPSHCTTEDFLKAIPTAINWIQNFDIKI
ncbi:hypothetical protein JTB14_027961 [Gonioctena quinquepunctata]|nr:hypothetical protein JTB14_027961 [Gonioctena quinquepunctata]